MPPLDPEQMRIRIEEAEDLPTLPTVLHSINEKIRSPSTSAQEVGELISEDQALTAKVLKVVNSAFYGFPRQINSVTRAIVILGFNKVRNIALAASVIDAFGSDKDGDFDFMAFWEHSLGTAIATEVVAKRANIPEVEEAFTAGLIHDIGKILLGVFFRQEYQGVVKELKSRPALIRVSEERVLGIDHTTVGFWICEKWNMPPPMTNSVRFHHRCELARENADLVHAVHLGDILARALGIGSGGDPFIPRLNSLSWERCGFQKEDLPDLVHETMSGLKRAGVFFDLIKGAGND